MLFLLPETPHFLMERGHEDYAISIIRKQFADPDSDLCQYEIKSLQEANRQKKYQIGFGRALVELKSIYSNNISSALTIQACQ